MTKQQSTFMQPSAVTEHLAGFTHELESVGYTKLTLAGYSMSIAHFAEWARRSDQLESDWSTDAIDRFARHRCRCPGRRRWHRVSGKYVRRVLLSADRGTYFRVIAGAGKAAGGYFGA